MVCIAPCGLSLAVESRGYVVVAMCRLLTVVVPLAVEHRLQGVRASVVVALWPIARFVAITV